MISPKQEVYRGGQEMRPELPPDLDEKEKEVYKRLQTAMEVYNLDTKQGEQRERVISEIREAFRGVDQFGVDINIPPSDFPYHIMRRIYKEAPQFSKEHPGILRTSLFSKLSEVRMAQAKPIWEYRQKNRDSQSSESEILAVLQKEQEEQLKFLQQLSSSSGGSGQIVEQLKREISKKDESLNPSLRNAVEEEFKGSLTQEEIEAVAEEVDLRYGF